MMSLPPPGSGDEDEIADGSGASGSGN